MRRGNTAAGQRQWGLRAPYLEVHGTSEPTIPVLITVIMTILGHLRGVEVGSKYSHNWLIVAPNPKP